MSGRAAGWLVWVGLGVALSGGIGVVVSATVLIGVVGRTEVGWEGGVVKPLSTTRPGLQPLLSRMAGVVLIRPAAVQAAVKNDGTAERLLKKLKLCGVVELGEERVAYVQVEKEGVRTVRKGQRLLDFVVEDIEGGKLTWSLEGVVVVLDH